MNIFLMVLGWASNLLFHQAVLRSLVRVAMDVVEEIETLGIEGMACPWHQMLGGL